MVHDISEHVYHLISGLFADDFVSFRCECGDDVTVIVFDSCDEEWFDSDAFVGECGVSVHHFSDGNFAWSEAKADDGVELSFDAEGSHSFDELFWCEE